MSKGAVPSSLLPTVYNAQQDEIPNLAASPDCAKSHELQSLAAASMALAS